MSLRVLSAVLFSPRGGSAHVTRGQVQGLRGLGCEVTLVAGSRSDQQGHGDAREFYGAVEAVSFDAALASPDPVAYAAAESGSAPMHPSYEERPDAPDRVFASLDDEVFERQVLAWSRALEAAGAAEADVLHLHHLTPLNEAAARVAPGVPVVGQLHGTELLMVERILSGPPPSWTHAERWLGRLRRWAAGCQRLLVAPGSAGRACRLLGLPREAIVELPNGVDTGAFRPRPVDRGVLWCRELVEQPRGWRPGEPAGSVRYAPEDVARLSEHPVLLYVGRFTAVKRLPELIEAFVVARAQAGAASLVLIGGHPGEWEGEHPADTVARLGAEHVFLAGWRSHEELPELLCGGDIVVSAARREQFGQLLVEGMACGLAPVALRALGPARIIADGRTGWLADPERPGDLVRVLAEAIAEPDERRRRGRAARAAVQERFSWPAVSRRLLEVLGAAARAPARPPRPTPA